MALLASGLASMLRRRERAGAGQPDDGDGLLPAAWRTAFGRLWWRCHEQGVAPLGNDLDLLALCAHPLAAWPVALSLSDQDLQSSLLVDGELSGLAEQSTRLAPSVDVESEWIENRVYEALRTAASENGGEDGETDRAYAALRRLLIDRPFLTDRDLKKLERQFRAADRHGTTYLRRLIEMAYVARPAQGPQVIIRCVGCGNILADHDSRCATPGCVDQPAESVTVTPLAAIFEQHRATRRFVHDPGLVEARILDRLSASDLSRRVRVTAYPALDTLDVLIEFLRLDGDGTDVVETWGVDAKDQTSPRLLGRMFRWPDTLPCDRHFLVLPHHRARQIGYIADLKAELEGRTDGVEVVDEKRLVALVTDRARRLGR
ncbi:hypothetical protein ND748_03255 [Frankia sp. AiPs1]|uniref:restriction endonuclease-related protein n=1 Tax=Frankia sp. AiPs1 TaxID=573493 RepID=UPI00204397A8|nr:hypothetical protein [Frankia sp. AiPs1]MCM3920694.1 hypothetical protein [Frankia sp. AiPs1]